jgi:hypothetical protein
VAEAFELAGAASTVECPVLRVLGEKPALSLSKGRESEIPAPSGFDHVSTTRSNSTRSIAALPLRQAKGRLLQKTQSWGTLTGNGACKNPQSWVTRRSIAHQRDPWFQDPSGSIFLFCMALLMAGLAVWGFSSTVDRNLLHAKPLKPLLLWFHVAAFSAWIALFVAQSALVRMRKVRVHRTLGWFGAALAAIMVVSGLIVSVVMLRFEMAVLNRPHVAKFLSVLWCDMIIFISVTTTSSIRRSTA